MFSVVSSLFVYPSPSCELSSPASSFRRSRSADADLIVHNAKVVTVDAKFSIAEAVAVQDGQGRRRRHERRRPASTRARRRSVIDAGGKTVLPGLYDSHIHPVGAAHERGRRAAARSCGRSRRMLRLHPQEGRRRRRRASGSSSATPSRRGSKEARFPTKAELDAAAPKHPVLYHAGPAGIANTHGAEGLRHHEGHAEPAGRASSSRTRRPASRPACSATPTAC